MNYWKKNERKKEALEVNWSLRKYLNDHCVVLLDGDNQYSVKYKNSSSSRIVEFKTSLPPYYYLDCLNEDNDFIKFKNKLLFKCKSHNAAEFYHMFRNIIITWFDEKKLIN